MTKMKNHTSWRKRAIISGCAAVLLLSVAGCVPKVGPTPPPLPTQQPNAGTTPGVEAVTPTQQPTAGIGQQPAGELFDPQSMATEQTLTISREGEEEQLVAQRQIAQAGYVIYTLQDFTWSEQQHLGMAIPAVTSALSSGITLKIIADPSLQPQDILEQAKLDLPNYTFEQRDAGLPVPPQASGVVGAYGEKGDEIAQISAFTLGSGTYAVIFTYPREAAEGGLVLLQAMLSTMAAYR